MDGEKKGPVLEYCGKGDEGSVVVSVEPVKLKTLRTHPPETADTDHTGLLIEGDNLPVMKTFLEKKGQGPQIKLVYIDPPFSSGQAYRTRDRAEAYRDSLGGAGFVDFMRRRLIFLRELLADDGSIYVHLDWRMCHYIKVVMDEVFGPENFLNEIIWNYGGRGAKAVSGQFSRNHDTILLYRKKSHLFNRIYTERRLPRKGFKRDSAGRWFKTSPRGDYTDESIAALEREGRIYRTRTGAVRIKYFLAEDGDHLIEKRPVGDVWDDIPDGMHLPRSERTGYPTQKPEALLARIILASSRPGDLVLDCFSGSGTTLAAAEKLGRRWIGIDSSRTALETAEGRLLNIKGTRHVTDGKKRYTFPCRPFRVMKAE